MTSFSVAARFHFFRSPITKSKSAGSMDPPVFHERNVNSYSRAQGIILMCRKIYTMVYLVEFNTLRMWVLAKILVPGMSDGYVSL